MLIGEVLEEPKNNQTTFTIYVLELQHKCYYVGITGDLEKRLSQHFSGHGSAWCGLHAPLRLILTIELSSFDEIFETVITLLYMRAKGWPYVRGGFYSCIKMSEPMFLYSSPVKVLAQPKVRFSDDI